MRTACVHAVGLTEHLCVVGLDKDGVVLRRKTLCPGKLLRIRGAAWVLELPIDDSGPAVGDRLKLYARRCERQADYLRNPDRQSG